MATKKTTAITATLPAQGSLDTKLEEKSFGPLEEIGRSGLQQFSGILDEEFLQDLRGAKARKMYREMRDNHPIIGAMFLAVEQLAKRADIFVDVGDDSNEGRKAADLVQTSLYDMENTWQDSLAEIMSFLPFGWQWSEQVFKVRGGDVNDPKKKSRYDDGLVSWRSWAPRPQETLTRWIFHPDDQRLLGMEQQPPPDYRTRVIPLAKSFHFRTRIEKNSPEGRSTLRAAYIPYYLQKRIQMHEAMGVERDLAGLPVALVPPEVLTAPSGTKNALIRETLARLVINIKRDDQEGVLFPYEYDQNGHLRYELKLLSTGGQRQFDTSRIIERYDQRIAMTILADFLLIGHSNVGSFALMDSKTNMFAVALGGWLDAIIAVINANIPLLMRLNGFRLKKYPTLRHGDIESPDLMELSTYVQRLAQSGMPMFPSPDGKLEETLLKAGNLPADWITDTEITKRNAGYADVVRAVYGVEKAVELLAADLSKRVDPEPAPRPRAVGRIADAARAQAIRKAGEEEGHPFRGNQFVEGQSDPEQARMERERVAQEETRVRREKVQAAPTRELVGAYQQAYQRWFASRAGSGDIAESAIFAADVVRELWRRGEHDLTRSIEQPGPFGARVRDILAERDAASDLTRQAALSGPSMTERVERIREFSNGLSDATTLADEEAYRGKLDSLAIELSTLRDLDFIMFHDVVRGNGNIRNQLVETTVAPMLFRLGVGDSPGNMDRGTATSMANMLFDAQHVALQEGMPLERVEAAFNSVVQEGATGTVVTPPQTRAHEAIERAREVVQRAQGATLDRMMVEGNRVENEMTNFGVALTSMSGSGNASGYSSTFRDATRSFAAMYEADKAGFIAALERHPDMLRRLGGPDAIQLVVDGGPYPAPGSVSGTQAIMPAEAAVLFTAQALALRDGILDLGQVERANHVLSGTSGTGDSIAYDASHASDAAIEAARARPATVPVTSGQRELDALLRDPNSSADDLHQRLTNLQSTLTSGGMNPANNPNIVRNAIAIRDTLQQRGVPVRISPEFATMLTGAAERNAVIARNLAAGVDVRTVAERPAPRTGGDIAVLQREHDRRIAAGEGLDEATRGAYAASGVDIRTPGERSADALRWASATPDEMAAEFHANAMQYGSVTSEANYYRAVPLMRAMVQRGVQFPLGTTLGSEFFRRLEVNARGTDFSNVDADSLLDSLLNASNRYMGGMDPQFLAPMSLIRMYREVESRTLTEPQQARMAAIAPELRTYLREPAVEAALVSGIGRGEDTPAPPPPDDDDEDDDSGGYHEPGGGYQDTGYDADEIHRNLSDSMRDRIYEEWDNDGSHYSDAYERLAKEAREEAETGYREGLESDTDFIRDSWKSAFEDDTEWDERELRDISLKLNSDPGLWPGGAPSEKVEFESFDELWDGWLGDQMEGENEVPPTVVSVLNLDDALRRGLDGSLSTRIDEAVESYMDNEFKLDEEHISEQASEESSEALSNASAEELLDLLDASDIADVANEMRENDAEYTDGSHPSDRGEGVPRGSGSTRPAPVRRTDSPYRGEVAFGEGSMEKKDAPFGIDPASKQRLADAISGTGITVDAQNLIAVIESFPRAIAPTTIGPMTGNVTLTPGTSGGYKGFSFNIEVYSGEGHVGHFDGGIGDKGDGKLGVAIGLMEIYKRGRGAATNLMNMVMPLSQMGVKEVTLSPTSSSDGSMNGAYTWAKAGIPEESEAGMRRLAQGYVNWLNDNGQGDGITVDQFKSEHDIAVHSVGEERVGKQYLCRSIQWHGKITIA